VEDHERLDPPPSVVTVAGLKEAVQVGAGIVVTVAVQVFVPPDPLSAVRVQVWVPVGEKPRDPLAVVRVPLPKFPVQLYGI
jgi:hypothetical protein